MNFIEKFTYFFLKVLSTALKNLSLNTQVSFSQNLASIFYHYIPKRKKLAKNNIKIAFPNKSEKWIDNTLRNTYKFFVFNFIQFLALPKSMDNIKIKIVGKEIMDNALKKNKGVILISAHFGSWEVLGHWLGINGYKLHGVAHEQNNKGANEFFQYKRELSGIKHIYKKVGLDNLYKVLQGKNILGLVSDQDAKSKGVFIKFFNKLSSTAKGVGLFHLNTKAPMVYGLSMQTGFQKYKIEFIQIKPKEDTIESITQNYTNVLESYINKYPEQYFWFHNRWKTSPEK